MSATKTPSRTHFKIRALDGALEMDHSQLFRLERGLIDFQSSKNLLLEPLIRLEQQVFT
jgi:hypothetical protein